MSQKLCLVLDGLNCADCASKIEARVNKLEVVESASFNFSTSEMTVNYKNNKIQIIKEISNIVEMLEPDVKVFEKNKRGAENKSKIESEVQSKPFSTFVIPISGIIIFIIAVLGEFGESVSFGLYTTSYLLLGHKVLYRAIKNLLNRGEIFDENFLMSIATLGAFYIGEYAEAVAVMIFYSIGEFLQDMAVNKSRNSIRTLIDLKVEYANVIRNGDIMQVDPIDVEIGETIVVKKGEQIPLDGIVTEGRSQIDTSSITGESVPSEVNVDDAVYGGCINIDNILKIRVEKDYENSTTSKIMDLIENASIKKAPVENFITKFSKVYTPIVVLIAILLATIPMLFLEGAIFSEWLRRSMVFLVVSCPCAVVISVPLGFFSGLGVSSKNGILIKGSNYLQLLASINTVIVDKTGTVTKGTFTVTEVFESTENSGITKYASALEKYSNHPIGYAIVNYENPIDMKVENFEELAGLGLKGYIESNEIVVGNDKMMMMSGIEYAQFNGIGSVVHVAKNSIYLGYLVVADEIKEDSKDAFRKLRELGIKNIVMLTGDRKATAEKVASEVGIDVVYSELLPHEKVIKLEEIYENNSNAKISFVGDGINDVPVLMRSDLGIAMGGVGSDAALESADIVVMNDELSKIATAIKISINTLSIIKQNIAFALAVKFLVLILASLGFASMWLAVFADVGVTLLVILNSMRKKY